MLARTTLVHWQTVPIFTSFYLIGLVCCVVKTSQENFDTVLIIGSTIKRNCVKTYPKLSRHYLRYLKMSMRGSHI